jgi:SAM-dependent methyltransferase
MKAQAFAHYARTYELLYRDKDYAAEARLVDGWLRQARVPAETLLDVGCGTGRHVREFAQRGWVASGVDRSAEMIAIARASGGAGNFHTAGAAEFDLGCSFGVVVSLFHVASYMSGDEELLGMFRNVRRHLAGGGVFLFDFWHGPGVLADPPAVRVRRVEDECIHVTRIAEPKLNRGNRQVDVAYEVIVEDKITRQVERIHELHRLKYYTLGGLEALLAKADLRIEASRAGLEDRPLEGNSWYGALITRAV